MFKVDKSDIRSWLLTDQAIRTTAVCDYAPALPKLAGSSAISVAHS